jgi:hypothetical protein
MTTKSHNPPIIGATGGLPARSRFDGLVAGGVFIVLALATGRVFRYPFDDEIFSLNLLESARGFGALWTDLLHAIDVHPPVSYLAFYTLSRIGFGEPGLRLFSLVCSALAVVLAHALMRQITPSAESSSGADRVVVILVLAATPLLLSQGDAIRWYPLFTLVFMATLYAYSRTRDAPGLGYAALAGLAASINFLGFLVLPLLEFDRLLRSGLRVSWGGAAARVGIWALFALPGIVTLWNGLMHGAHTYVAGQIGGGLLTTLVTTTIGFFGGNSLGLIQAIALLPIVALTVLTVILSLRDPVSRFVALQIVVIVAMLAVGFSKPRSFAYLALGVSILIGQRWLITQHAGVKLALGLTALLTPACVLANIRWNDTPYKRNAMLPVEEILRFADANTTGADVIIVSDVVLNWELRHAGGGVCVSYYLTNARCDLQSAPRLLVIDGYAVSSPERDQWLAAKSALVASRREIAVAYFGVDHEAKFKRRLIPGLDDYLEQAVVYDKAP